MKIYSVQSNIPFQPKFAQNPIVQNTIKIAKKTNETISVDILGGLLHTGEKIIKQTQDLLIETRANKILENHPKQEEILSILRESDKEAQQSKLDFLELIKNISMSDGELSYLLRLLKDKFPKEPVIAKVWGLCMQNGLDIYTLKDITYNIDEKCAKDKAGFNFPIELSNCNIRAMEDMIEVEYPFNNKNITIRKSKKYDGRGDISGDYNNYAVNKELSINGVKFNIRGQNDKDKINVVNFSSNKAHYAIMCNEGLSSDEILNIYEIIKKAERL